MFQVIVSVAFVLLFTQLLWASPAVDFTVRMGQGGFSDNRSPIGKLGGGQMSTIWRQGLMYWLSGK